VSPPRLGQTSPTATLARAKKVPVAISPVSLLIPALLLPGGSRVRQREIERESRRSNENRGFSESGFASHCRDFGSLQALGMRSIVSFGVRRRLLIDEARLSR
jgi:hypothetical protein